jgi:hypothetical protein
MVATETNRRAGDAAARQGFAFGQPADNSQPATTVQAAHRPTYRLRLRAEKGVDGVKRYAAR